MQVNKSREAERMTFKTIVTYQIHDGRIMTKEMDGVEKVERAFEKINGENHEVVRVHTSYHNWSTWEAGSILSISMIPERV